MVFWSSTSFRSCVHPKGTSYGRPHWAIRGGVPPLSIRGGVPPLSIRAGRSTPFRSALIPNIRNSRS